MQSIWTEDSEHDLDQNIVYYFFEIKCMFYTLMEVPTYMFHDFTLISMSIPLADWIKKCSNVLVPISDFY